MRIRDIKHASGKVLRIGLDRDGGEDSMIIQLSDPLEPSGAPVLLDLYGAELLAGFVMSARLALAGDLAEEQCGGTLGCRLRLRRGAGETAIELTQGAKPLRVPAPLWDRLYAELMLVLAHGRHLAGARHGGSTTEAKAPARILH